MTNLPAIRIAHFADTHLGYRGLNRLDPATERNQRSVDFERAYECAIDAILEQRPDLVLHAGDLFHHTRPTWHAMRHFVTQTRRLTAAGLPVVIIAGNHDTPRLRTSGTAFSLLELALPEVHFIAGYEEEERRFEELGVTVFGVPHGAMSLSVYDPVAQIVPGRRNILLIHGMIPGMSDIAHYEPGTQEISATLVDPEFSYIALGHYHVWSHQRRNAWYAGSTERTGWGDETAEPGFLMVEFAEGAYEVPSRVEHVPLPARPMKTLSAIDGDGRPAREIADIALRRCEAVGDSEAMTRVELRNVTRATRREVEQMIRRELNGRVWTLDCFARADLALSIGDRAPLDSEQINVRALFEEFVEEQVSLERYDQQFASVFRERGLAALGLAMEQVTLALAEDAG